jgi:diadenosine tetraphosphate (Ap4A) HIT family hydrolase
VQAIERAPASVVDYERINYLMLMMVDPNVHFHVIPRYSKARHWKGLEFPDVGWPGPPQLGSAIALSTAKIAEFALELASNFR